MSGKYDILTSQKKTGTDIGNKTWIILESIPWQREIEERKFNMTKKRMNSLIEK